MDEASTGLEAVARVTAKPEQFDVVLMHLTMPEMGGYEATRRLAVTAPGLPVVISSGYSAGDGPASSSVLARPSVASCAAMTHLPEEVLARVAHGELQPDPAQASHLQVCQECTAIVSGLMRAQSGSGLEMTARSPGGSGGVSVVHEFIGRYQVTRLLGEGAMGRVFEALDPELGRHVAIKVVRGASSSELRARLLREAQTAARLKHPNIVTVYDAGTVGEEVFVAMELVTGGSLRGWVEQKPRWQDVVRVFVGAGKGLAAVHDAGLVHRDFKPDNVLLEADGTARVSDFGLVGLERSGPPSIAQGTSTDLTRSGTLMGTPAYMSPELFSGSAATPASDQFAFCVSLFEALAGERPFRASTLAELKAAVKTGQFVAAPPGAPTWLMRVAHRGLSADPARRFPSMHALVKELAETAERRRRRTGVALGSVAAFALVGSVAFFARASPCAGFTVGDAWNPEVRAAVERALNKEGAPASLIATVTADLDGYVQQWIGGQQAACTATRVRGEQSDAVLDQRVTCLDQRRRELRALTTLLSNADTALTRRAATLTGHLPSIDTCADLEAVKSERPLPQSPDERREVLAARDTLAQVFALSEAGHVKDSLALALEVDATLEKLQYTPQRAESQLRIGQLNSALSNFDEAEKHLREATLIATSTGQDRIAARALGMEATNLAEAQRNGPALDTALSLATATLARVGNPDQSLDDLLFAVGSVRIFQGRFDEAEKAFSSSLAIRLRLHGPHHPRVAAGYNALGVVHDNQGKAREALADYDKAEAIWLATVGPMHPNLASNYNNKAIVYSALGQKEDSLAAHAKALEIRKTLYGAQSREVAQTLSNMAAELGRGRQAEAVERYKEARALYVKLGGEESADVARLDENLANAYRSLGNLDEARARLKRSLEVREKVLGPDHQEVGRSLHGMGDLLGSTGSPAEAIPYFERAAKIFEKTYGPKHGITGYAISGLGDALFALKKWNEAETQYARAEQIFRPLDPPDVVMLGHCLAFIGQSRENLGKSAEARTFLEEAVTVLSTMKQPEPLETGQAKSALAQLLWPIAAERKRAGTLSAEAVPLLEAAGQRGAKDLAEFKKWRARHP